MGLRELFVALVALLCLGLGLLLLEQPRTGLAISNVTIGGIPATVMQVPRVEAPVVIIAHGYAGSRPMMHPLQLTLARAGYITVSVDLAGHGENPTAMRGGPEFLTEDLWRVMDAASALPGADGRLALVGQGMASDVMVRGGISNDRIASVVAISLETDRVTSEAPANLLIINGQLEAGRRAEARQIMVDHQVAEGETAGDPASGFARRSVHIPGMEYLGTIYAPATLQEVRDWLNASFDKDSENGLAWFGPPIVLTLLGLVLIAQPIAQTWPAGQRLPEVPSGAFWALAFAPAVLTPLMLLLVPTNFLDLAMVDYLAIHLAIYGALVLGGLVVEGDLPRVKGWRASFGIVIFGVLVVGAVLDRYVVNFILSGERWQVFAVLLPGSMLAMVADATLIQAGRARPWRRLVARAGFVLSLTIAMVLSTERVSFLLPILPVMVLFFLTFGLIGGWVGRRSGSAMAMGLGLGVLLAWTLAASLPLIEA